MMSSRILRGTARFASGMLLLGVLPLAASAQRITKQDYLRYMPLEYPRMQQATAASMALQLYGDQAAPGYRDFSPRNGIDDRRDAVFMDLGVRFAPLMVQNSVAMPMDFRRFGTDGRLLPLYVDTWNLVTKQLVREEMADYGNLAEHPCPQGALFPKTEGRLPDDCLVASLVNDFHPFTPASALERAQAIGNTSEPFRVLYLDFPGGSAQEWKEIYQDPHTGKLRPEMRDWARVYMHPFISESGPEGDAERYELVLQYWFFYPTNDGGNNHIGDWEHLNVIISPRDRVTRLLSAAEVTAMLDGELADSTGPAQLVIRRIDYYLHNKVMPLSFAEPNAYAPREVWQRQVRNTPEERAGAKKMWEHIRDRAYWDDKETIVNTNPVVFIGADNKGTDQVLAKPGGANRDSHGSYPFPGLYTDIGPGGATEGLNVLFDHRAYYAASPVKRQDRWERWSRGGVVPMNRPERVLVIPDGERVIDLVVDEPAVRAEWAWLVLPLRWGYPAIKSPFSGIVSNAETGNLSPVGPAHSTGWNRTGPSATFALYDPHALPRFFPSRWQDEFSNSYGWLNLTLPTLSLLPPFDLIWRGLAAPVRVPLESGTPAYHPASQLPVRFFGITGGVTIHGIGDQFEDLLYNDPQLNEFTDRLVTFLVANATPNTVLTGRKTNVENAVSGLFQINFFVGDRFVSENSLRHSRSGIRETFHFNDIPDFRLASELNMWEYAGSLRYNLTRSSFQPFAKIGYGNTWYRLEKVSTQGTKLPTPSSAWVRNPFENAKYLLPNTWHVGAGIDIGVFRGRGPFIPGGLDFSLKVDWTMYTHNLGLDETNIPLDLLVSVGRTAADLPRDQRIFRHSVNLGGTLSF
jgi:hypothetical protein